MRRSEREVTSAEEISVIMARASVLYLALHNDPAPSVVPVYFGFEPGRLYVHGAREGTRLSLLRARPDVGFCAVAEARVVEGASACDFTARAQSVMGTGTGRVVTDEAERVHGLDLIMAHAVRSAPAGGFSYRPGSLERTSVIAIEIASITGKRIG